MSPERKALRDGLTKAAKGTRYDIGKQCSSVKILRKIGCGGGPGISQGCESGVNSISLNEKVNFSNACFTLSAGIIGVEANAARQAMEPCGTNSFHETQRIFNTTCQLVGRNTLGYAIALIRDDGAGENKHGIGGKGCKGSGLGFEERVSVLELLLN
jgi:hypothetical protein